MTREEQKAQTKERHARANSIVSAIVEELMDKMNLNSCVYYDKCRDKDHCDVRRVIQHTLFNRYKFGMSQIARNANTTHASVIHNVNQCEFLIQHNDVVTLGLIRRMKLEEQEDECERVL